MSTHQKLKLRLPLLLAVLLLGALAAAAQTNSASTLIEAAGTVEFFTPAATNWQAAAAGRALNAGDKIRTRAQSRAAVQLSDRSIVRLDELTTLEILPPRNAEKKRFGLLRGAIYFFNREKPADVEFDTPLAAGAIRGTEFLLEVASGILPDVEPGFQPGGKNVASTGHLENSEAGGNLSASPGGKMPPSTAGRMPAATVHLALMDGLVSLKSATEEINLQRGEELRLVAGQPAQKTALVNATAKIQWALYYPGVIHPAELSFDPLEQVALAEVLKNYRAGDLLAALAAWPAALPADSDSAKIFRAQLDLAVGRGNESESKTENVRTRAPENSAATALHELITVVRGETERRAPARLVDGPETGRAGARRSASELLAHSYALQAAADLPNARAAAKQAAALAPDFGFAHARLAELEFAFGNRDAALRELKLALEISPRLAAAHALQGFVLLDSGDVKSAQHSFDHARELDAALGSAWLGRGLCLLRERNFPEARAAFQAAAALEPQRSLFRSYLGKAASELGDAKAAEKEFRLAKELDANDPTAWLYSALHLWQENKLNAAIRDLETSYDKNDNRAAFRSRELLDGDKSVRSANLAAIYDDAGLTDVSRHVAARAVEENYANFSGHLFLANSYAAQQDLNRFDLRLETAKQSELLVANLLAPPGAGNLSQVLSQSDRLRFFDTQPFGISSLTTYRSRGDWSETATVFGAIKNFSYALDTELRQFNGQRANNAGEQRDFALTLKQRLTARDDLYFQIGDFQSHAGDVSKIFEPTNAKANFRVREKQQPDIYAGWHHEWQPGSHTLVLVSRLNDRLAIHDDLPNTLTLRQIGGVTAQVLNPSQNAVPLILNSRDRFGLWSAELQHIWETAHQSLVVGARWQRGDVQTGGTLNPAFNGPIVQNFSRQAGNGTFGRENIYGYYSLRPTDALTLVAGASYDHLEFPRNADFPPVSLRETSRDKVSPKAGILFSPWKHGLFRASYTRSLGGLFFDNSIRLEPTQVGGFNQAYRSLLPESVAGLLPGAEFETASVGFDQSLNGKTFFGVEAEWLNSDGTRAVGTITNSFFLPIYDSPGTTRQKLDFQERSVSFYAAQLLGDYFSASARFRMSEAKLVTGFPDIPKTAIGLDQVRQNDRAVLDQFSVALNFNHPCGFFSQWESSWHHQNNFGYAPELSGADFWQHNLTLGYRFAHRHAEIRAAILNLTDEDYRLNPLNLSAELPRGRTFVASLRLNF